MEDQIQKKKKKRRMEDYKENKSHQTQSQFFKRLIELKARNVFIKGTQKTRTSQLHSPCKLIFSSSLIILISPLSYFLNQNSLYTSELEALMDLKGPTNNPAAFTTKCDTQKLYQSLT